MALLKLEGMITVPTGGWSASITDNDGTFTATVAAGDYFLTSTTSLLAAFKTALDNGAGVTYTVTVDDADPTGTGKVTITPSAGNVAITWTSTSLRDALGFTGNLSAASTQVSPSSSPYIYLPNVQRSPAMAPEGSNGYVVNDSTVTVAPSGNAVGLQYNKRYINTLGFRFLLANKGWIAHEVVANESLESFYNSTIGAVRPFRIHPDRSVDATFTTWRAAGASEIALTPAIPNMTTGATSLWHFGDIQLIKYV